MVHQDGERAFVVLQDVLLRWLVVGRSGWRRRHLDEAVVGRVLSIERVLVEHFANHVGGRFPDRKEKSLVRHVPAETLAVNLSLKKEKKKKTQ